MDLLLLNDKLGGRLKDGGIAFPRFVVPGRRQRGTEGGEPNISDTFLSASGSRMMLDEHPREPAEPHKVNYAVTRASGDQNSFFVLNAKATPREKADPALQSAPLVSARTQHNKRMAKELRSIAARAGQVHIGAGNSFVLIDCTPRSARWEPGRSGAQAIRLTRNQVAAVNGYTASPSLASTPASSRQLSTETSRVAATTIASARFDRVASSRSEGRGGAASSRIAETARVTDEANQITPLESERQILMKEMRLLERKLGKLEGVLESKSNRSRSEVQS